MTSLLIPSHPTFHSRYDTKEKNHDKSIKFLGSNGDIFSSTEHSRNIRIQEDGCRVSHSVYCVFIALKRRITSYLKSGDFHGKKLGTIQYPSIHSFYVKSIHFTRSMHTDTLNNLR